MKATNWECNNLIFGLTTNITKYKKWVRFTVHSACIGCESKHSVRFVRVHHTIEWWLLEDIFQVSRTRLPCVEKNPNLSFNSLGLERRTFLYPWKKPKAIIYVQQLNVLVWTARINKTIVLCSINSSTHPVNSWDKYESYYSLKILPKSQGNNQINY